MTQANLECYVMHRKGSFDALRFTDNQCKGHGHLSYNYQMCLVVKGGKKSLDDDGFIIDHVDLDSFIRSAALTGSCEEMQLQVARELPAFLKRKNIPCIGYRLTIKPIMPHGFAEAPAYMEYVHVEGRKYWVLPLLSFNN